RQDRGDDLARGGRLRHPGIGALDVEEEGAPEPDGAKQVGEDVAAHRVCRTNGTVFPTRGGASSARRRHHPFVGMNPRLKKRRSPCRPPPTPRRRTPRPRTTTPSRSASRRPGRQATSAASASRSRSSAKSCAKPSSSAPATASSTSPPATATPLWPPRA